MHKFYAKCNGHKDNTTFKDMIEESKIRLNDKCVKAILAKLSSWWEQDTIGTILDKINLCYSNS